MSNHKQLIHIMPSWWNEQVGAAPTVSTSCYPRNSHISSCLQTLFGLTAAITSTKEVMFSSALVC